MHQTNLKLRKEIFYMQLSHHIQSRLNMLQVIDPLTNLSQNGVSSENDSSIYENVMSTLHSKLRIFLKRFGLMG